MRFYFDTLKNVSRLRDVLDSWIGTPFASNSGVKYEGVDCIHLIGCVLVECEARKRIIVPSYPDEWYRHGGDDRFVKGIKRTGGEEIDLRFPRNGDIMMFNVGRAVAHAGFYLDEKLYHIVQGSRVHTIPWINKTWYKRRVFGFRIWEHKVQ